MPKESDSNDYEDMSAMSVIAIAEGRYNEAIEMCKKALKLAREANDDSCAAVLKDRLKMLTMVPGDPERSMIEYVKELGKQPPTHIAGQPIIKRPYVVELFEFLLDGLLHCGIKNVEEKAYEIFRRRYTNYRYEKGVPEEIFLNDLIELESLACKYLGNDFVDCIYDKLDDLFKAGAVKEPLYDRKRKKIYYLNDLNLNG
ncbi:MAG: hypothetical protein ACTSQP_08220 [Promethearchaeota archaeon]